MHEFKVVVALSCLVATAASAQSLWLAESLADSCDYELALANWAKAPEVERKSFDGRLLKARLLVQLNRGVEAIPLLTVLRAEATEKRLPDVLLSLGMAQSAATMFVEAETTLRLAGEKGADGELVDSAVAEVRLSAGKTAEAEAMLRQVLRRTPDLVGPIMNLAIVRAKEGNTAEAVALIRLAWNLGYQNPKELRTTPEFARIRELGLLKDLTSVAVGRCTIY